jgi:hypothetical protein
MISRYDRRGCTNLSRAAAMHAPTDEPKPKRKRYGGRKLGSRNKKTLAKIADAEGRTARLWGAAECPRAIDAR